ncbi:MAG: ribonuclease J [Clostridia bacterium]|nr:ribonuclease J [Clostridia bacterium]
MIAVYFRCDYFTDTYIILFFQSQKGGTYLKKIDKVRVIPLGGLNEIGKNLTLIECGKDIIAVDCGLAFPDEEMPGVDYVIPDMQYIVKNKDRFRAIFITHGHEDHIGAIPYLLRDINVPIYGTRLTLGIIQNKLREFRLDKEADLVEVRAGQTVDLDTLSVEFIHVNHSIADASALAIHTPCGTILHMGDFKIDVTPVDGEMIDLTRIGELGKEGVMLLMMESTNVERPGFAMSELKVRDSLRSIFSRASSQRIIIATFASNVHRVQTIIDLAADFNRKVAVSGRSMVTVIEVARQLGYMSIPDHVLIDIEDVNNYPPEKVVIITTGSQGEPMSALYRMAYSDHKVVEINNRDLVIISATAIPGNEKLVNRVVNELFRSGAEVVYESLAEVHVSGHACQEELKLIFGLARPKFFIPVHGEYRHLKRHEALALSLGIPQENIVVADIGNIVEVCSDDIRTVGTVPAGRVLVDGLGVGDVGNVVLRDRKHLSQDGLIMIVAVVDEYTQTVMPEPEVISRGFVYAKENENIVEKIKDITVKVIGRCASDGYDEWAFNAKARLKDEVAKYVSEQTKRKPMIIPVIKVI